MALIDKITTIADAIRSKLGTSEKMTLDEMATAISDFPIGPGYNKLAMVVDKTVTELTAKDLLGVTSIGGYAFNNCSSLESITIPDSVTSIGEYAFNNCSSLESITIPDSVTACSSRSLRIGSNTSKATITMLSTTPPTIQSDTFYANYLNKIIVPKGTGNAYKSATNWSAYADYIEEATE